MEGLWQGVPEFNIIGPWASNYTFGISRASNGDYLFENNLPYDSRENFRSEKDLLGWQRMYIEGSSGTPGLLWYCGTLFNYAPVPESTAGDVLMIQGSPKATDRSISFCAKVDNAVGYLPVKANVGAAGCV